MMQRVFQQSSRQLIASSSRPYRVRFVARHNLAPLSTSPLRPAHSDYGSGDPNPGPNPSEHLEHPGPPAPDTSGSGPSASKSGKGRPIHVDQQDGSSTDPEVQKHNAEMEKRAARSHDRESASDPKDKVEKGFWKGEGDQ